MNLRGRGLLLLSIALSGTPPAGAQAVGFGRTYGEALVRAQQNARSREMWAEVGEDMAAYVREREARAQELAAAREAYWGAAASGRMTRALEERYREALWQKDLHYLGIAILDVLKPISPGSGLEGIGTLLDGLSGLAAAGRGSIDPIHPYAKPAFDRWISHLQVEWSRQRFDLVATVTAARETYAVYQERRDVAEYLFVNPWSPLQSSDPRDFLVGWMLASGSSATFAAAERRVDSMREVLGEAAVERAATAVREGRLRPKEVKPQHAFDAAVASAAALEDRYVDWLATKDDPELYALYLVKRWSQRDWDWAREVHRGRVARLGADVVAAAVREAFDAAEDPASACVGEPNLQLAKTSTLPDCVAQRLGPFTLWDDARDLAFARMDRGAMKARMLEHLRASPQRGDAATRYARIVSAVAEPLLLAALHQHAHGGGIDPLIGKEPANAGWDPFQEELRILEGFAASEGGRTFAVMALKDSTKGEPLERLELAVEKYHARVASLGEQAFLAAVSRIRPRAAPSWKGMFGYEEALKQELGESPRIVHVVRDEASRERGRLLSTLTSTFSVQYTEPLYEPIGLYFVRRGLSPKETLSRYVARMQSALGAFREAAAALERYEQDGRAEDLRAGVAAGVRALAEGEFAYACVREDDPSMTAIRTGPYAGDHVGQLRTLLEHYTARLAALGGPVPDLPPAGSPPEPSAEERRAFEVDQEARVGRRLRIEGAPKDASVLVRGPGEERFRELGLAETYATRGRRTRDLTFPKDGVWMLLLRREGQPDYRIRLTVADRGDEVSPIRVGK